MVLLISYDLNGHERPSAYQRVKSYIEEHAASYRRPLYSQWLIETQYSVDAWTDALRSNAAVDDNDRLFIVQVRRPYQGWLDQGVWDWLNARVS